MPNVTREAGFTSPNDVVVKSDGSIWFTDPDYGILVPGIGDGDMLEQDRNRVYRIDPATGQVDSMCEEFDKPNGLAFSPDESVLYIADSGRTHGEFRNHHVMTFDVVDGWRSASKTPPYWSWSIREYPMACVRTQTANCT